MIKSVVLKRERDRERRENNRENKRIIYFMMTSFTIKKDLALLIDAKIKIKMFSKKIFFIIPF